VEAIQAWAMKIEKLIYEIRKAPQDHKCYATLLFDGTIYLRDGGPSKLTARRLLEILESWKPKNAMYWRGLKVTGVNF